MKSKKVAESIATPSNDCASKKNARITTIRKMNLLDIIQTVARLSEHKGITETGSYNKYLKVLSERLGLTQVQGLIMSVMASKFNDKDISHEVLARHFNTNVLEMIKYQSDLDILEERGLINNMDDGDYASYRVPFSALRTLGEGKLPDSIQEKCSDAMEWLEKLERLVSDIGRNYREERLFSRKLMKLIQYNLHLEVVRKISLLGLNVEELKLYLCIIIITVLLDRDILDRSEIEELGSFPDRYKIKRLFNSNSSALYSKNLIEHVNNNGIVDPDHITLTDYSKNDILYELNLIPRPLSDSSLISCHSITPKPLYYNPEMTRQIEQLCSMLDIENMNKIMKRMESKGMRKGFACLFYGAPGTGKTETVLQLARSCGRDIMQVDISTVRDCWVGETEKNIKRYFERYRRFAHKNEKAPILFFNEADALFDQRIAKTSRAVDKMENAMENIILQELENLEGILIATTNFATSLDSAFERRFLFKIEFTRPTVHERWQIWKGIMPDLSEEQARMLAERFEFSGGEIENIARKQIIQGILTDSDVHSIDGIIECCLHEAIMKENNRRIGF